MTYLLGSELEGSLEEIQKSLKKDFERHQNFRATKPLRQRMAMVKCLSLCEIVFAILP